MIVSDVGDPRFEVIEMDDDVALGVRLNRHLDLSSPKCVCSLARWAVEVSRKKEHVR